MELHPMLDSDTMPNTGLWYVLSTFGDSPSIRVGHTCSFVKGSKPGDNGRLYVIGGANPSGAFCDTFYMDLNTMQWDIIDYPGFRARYEHAAFVPESTPDKIYVFGGADPTGNMNDIQVLDTSTNSWSTPPITGKPPSPRTFHTTAVVGDRFIVYSGGHSGPDPVGDRQVHCFDSKSGSWSILHVQGDSPKPRHGHVMVGIGNRLFIHGGMAGASFYDDLHILDLNKRCWSNARKKKVFPSARAAHSGMAYETDLYIFGGMNREGALDDLHRLDTVSMVWTKMELQGPPPACRLDFGMCYLELERSFPDTAEDDDIVGATLEAQEVLDRELKPGSASSRGSSVKPGSASSRESFSLRDLKPGSASSRDSRHDTSSESSSQGNEGAQNLPDPDLLGAEGPGSLGDPLSDREEEEEEETPRPEGATGTSSVNSPPNTMTLKFCLIHGGMDTEGEIFDDSLLYVIPKSS
ncbi:rab9 effector protein with kelch motifs-like [Argopecten irradians]|uniref:rab9 effector protein with kelch motifs-like n=1 Tax=Argopecten irradians TaxID=31199 RepID=UPI00371C1C8E